MIFRTLAIAATISLTATVASAASWTFVAGSTTTVAEVACKSKVASPYGDLYRILFQGQNHLPRTESVTGQAIRSGSVVGQASVILAPYASNVGGPVYASVLLHDTFRGFTTVDGVRHYGPQVNPANLTNC